MSLEIGLRAGQSSPKPAIRPDNGVSAMRSTGFASVFSSILAGRRALAVASQALVGKVGGNAAAPSAKEFGAVQLLRSLPQRPKVTLSPHMPAPGKTNIAAQDDSNERCVGSPARCNKAGDGVGETAPQLNHRVFVVARVQQVDHPETSADFLVSTPELGLPMRCEVDPNERSADQPEYRTASGGAQERFCGTNSRTGGAPVCLSVSIRDGVAEVTARVSGLEHDQVGELDRRIRGEFGALGKPLGHFRLNGVSLHSMGRR